MTYRSLLSLVIIACVGCVSDPVRADLEASRADFAAGRFAAARQRGLGEISAGRSGSPLEARAALVTLGARAALREHAAGSRGAELLRDEVEAAAAFLSAVSGGADGRAHALRARLYQQLGWAPLAARALREGGDLPGGEELRAQVRGALARRGLDALDEAGYRVFGEDERRLFPFWVRGASDGPVCFLLLEDGAALPALFTVTRIGGGLRLARRDWPQAEDRDLGPLPASEDAVDAALREIAKREQLEALRARAEEAVAVLAWDDHPESWYRAACALGRVHVAAAGDEAVARELVRCYGGLARHTGLVPERLNEVLDAGLALSHRLEQAGALPRDAAGLHRARAVLAIRAHAYPLAAASLALADDGAEAAALRNLLTVLHQDRFRHEQSWPALDAEVFRCESAPPEDGRRFHEWLVVIGGGRAVVTSTRQKDGENLSYAIYRRRLSGETLVEACGSEAPALARLQDAARGILEE